MIVFGRRIISEQYHDGEPVKVVTEIEREHFTIYENLLRDFVESVSLLSEGTTTKLDISISINKEGRYKYTDRFKEN